MERTAFISYRRDISHNKPLWIRFELRRRQCDAWVDKTWRGGGQINPALVAEIRRRAHFLLLLEPGTLNRIFEPDDYVHAEIRCALETRRAIVPVLLNGARMPRLADLPADIADLCLIPPLTITLDSDCMNRLVDDRFAHPQFPPDPELQIWESSRDNIEYHTSAKARQTLAVPRLVSRNQPGHGVLLMWTTFPHHDYESVTLYRSSHEHFLPDSAIYSGHGWRHLDRGVTATTAYYRVRAPFRGDIGGLWSNTVQVDNAQVVRPEPLPTFGRVPILFGSRSDGETKLFWPPVPDAVEYQVVRVDPLAQELPGSAGHAVVYRKPAGKTGKHIVTDLDGFWDFNSRFHLRARCTSTGWTDWSRPVRGLSRHPARPGGRR